MSDKQWEEKGVIAVGLDQSAASRQAMLWAAREASRRGATLQVITAWSFEPLEGAQTFVWIIGIWAVFSGILSIVLAFRIRGEASRLGTPSGGGPSALA